jgi:hypothetical protein
MQDIACCACGFILATLLAIVELVISADAVLLYRISNVLSVSSLLWPCVLLLRPLSQSVDVCVVFINLYIVSEL